MINRRLYGVGRSVETFGFLASPLARLYNTVYAVRYTRPNSALRLDLRYAWNVIQNIGLNRTDEHESEKNINAEGTNRQ